MKKILPAMLVVIILSACAPSAQAVQTAIALTQAAAIPPTLTASPIPTATPRPTKTTTPTATASNTPTSTHLPETQTKVSAIHTATRQARQTSDASTAAARITTSTAQAVSAYKTKIAEYKLIDVRELVTYPKNHVGEKVVITGRVFNVVDNGQILQVYIGNRDAVYVELDDPAVGVYEDDTVTIYGVVFGTKCFDNTFGNTICQPAIYKAFIADK